MIHNQIPTDIHFMRRALELARLGQGSVSPNPMVGCVIVHNNRIIGEGWHQKYGSWHAEVNAIQSVKEKDLVLLPDSTVYVTLEPCAHFGKTPPCSDLLITKKVRRVVIANVDTNPLVGGKGIEKLKNAGIEVTTGILEEEGRWLNRRFFTFIEKNRPYIILKWAQTADRFIARSDYNSRWISNDWSRRLVHKWRGEEPAIMVGTTTAQYDNPRLNVRDWTGEDPVRIVIDRHLRLSPSLHLFDQTQPTLCYNLKKDEASDYIQYIKCVSESTFLAEMMADLHQRKIQSVIVEGGSKLLQELILSDLWDEVRVFTSDQTFGTGITAPVFGGILIDKISIKKDQLSVFIPVTDSYKQSIYTM
ncbi:bifunctional diaminohydroxyphosphoribosylaminopyrimidine deaminase/5-amino-6-(5-phosphoribosylamino)uracil reductase RibD [Xanthocytophaga flava]|uniref:bifunctional diaminohydroxyphosphoribosylaminopyrimidine deaminase/5-amino-6-(5-phosphoribosylamino)uracil reductase RibD n=1 Tax=Xanthocytophaga flava TaxID=3048013 RepID=UPI0028D230BB|nr:bifunctional diaminohydroxyphosphoribosylaminopyrimidine deaminase/5-amino-6-(5-phosphoribosylamino)uracil reductase RibD [Xanthocytophaga flavus]MDJ1469827.1 bifunctional diaminohydroxyphosphoribosylaminopyrimidine deaminase/5-amino-6-(5-phosphoribosylamino)uracil reductase RibD [Xanthocytophaga flavus]